MIKNNLSDVVTSLSALPAQLDEVLNGKQLFTWQPAGPLNKVVVCGMGGSNLGGRIIASALAKQLTAPLLINAQYTLPKFVDQQTLLILSSYSGNTEETVANARLALRAKAQIVVLTADQASQLNNFARQHHLPLLAFPTQHNPSGQPRLGLGYSVAGLLVILRAAGLLKLNSKELTAVIHNLSAKNKQLALKAANNPAKKLANNINKQVVLAGPEFLAGNLHTLRNQLNENAKHFASYLTVPDMNHYALEGLAKPGGNRRRTVFVFFNSALAGPKISRRSQLTRTVVKKNGLTVLEHALGGATELAQALEMLQFGAWLSFYLAVKNKVNPLAIPWVDWFKQQLK